MKYLTEQELLDRAAGLGGYWTRAKARARWPYMQRAIELLKETGASKVAEAGTEGITLTSSSTVIPGKPELDLDRVPWPYRDKQFDCFVALQVWEHLRRPRDAFREAARISRWAILSTPFEWGPRETARKNHRGISLSRINRWAGGRKPRTWRLVAEPDRPEKRRIVCLWHFGEGGNKR